MLRYAERSYSKLCRLASPVDRTLVWLHLLSSWQWFTLLKLNQPGCSTASSRPVWSRQGVIRDAPTGLKLFPLADRDERSDCLKLFVIYSYCLSLQFDKPFHSLSAELRESCLYADGKRIAEMFQTVLSCIVVVAMKELYLKVLWSRVLFHESTVDFVRF